MAATGEPLATAEADAEPTGAAETAAPDEVAMGADVAALGPHAATARSRAALPKRVLGFMGLVILEMERRGMANHPPAAKVFRGSLIS